MIDKKYQRYGQLRQARELRGWTQQELADIIQLPDARTLRRWESGTALPSLRYRARLCAAFARSPEELGLVSAERLEQDEREEQTEDSLSSEPDRPAPAAPPVHTNWNRLRLLGKVQAFWIKGVLEPSLTGHMYIKLALQVQCNAVAHPWNEIIQLSPSHYPLPPDTSILDVYDDACGDLLILGEPGSGKTTLLLELARDLLKRAYEDEKHPIPVVFDLASWHMKQASLARWLVEELHHKYQVPHHIGQRWVRNDQILPLLDGLGKVGPDERKSCIDAINEYQLEHGLVPLVVCSRREEYFNAENSVQLQRAVCIQPLTPQNIEDYFTWQGKQCEPLRAALRSDADLRQLITTPLMLRIVEQVYAEGSVETQEEQMIGLSEVRRKQVLAAYTAYMLKRRKATQHYSVIQSTPWLSYLVRQMKDYGYEGVSHLVTRLLATNSFF